jgi:hypothetical protein
MIATCLSQAYCRPGAGRRRRFFLILSFLCSGVIGLVPVTHFLSGISHADTMNEDIPQTVMLKDVHPLHGGRNVYLRGDGTGFCQVVNWQTKASNLYERRYRIAVSHDWMLRLAHLMRSAAFSSLSFPARPGVPDEAKPAISVAFFSGTTLHVSKWANDTYPAFDQIYEVLLAEVQSAQRATPVHEGTYDARWAPEGFAFH